MQSKGVRTALVWVLLILVGVLVLSRQRTDALPQLDYATFRAHVAERAVVAVRVESNEITVTLQDGFRYTALGLVDEDLTRLLSEQGVLIAWGPEKDRVGTALVWLVGAVVVLALLLFFVKKAQGGTMNLMQLRRSRARLLSDARPVRFSDVGGCEDAKQQLGDLVDFLKDPGRWTGAGVRLPRGVLLEGPPGCGKTLLARAVAGETDAHFYVVSASEFVEMFVGVGAARVRDMFEVAAKQAPSVIFIDELDAVGRKRGSGIGAAHDEREQTLNQILVCMDGFEPHDRVVVVAATNRADILDAALLRAGRFDRRIRIGELSRDQRVAVFAIHTRNKKLADDVDLAGLAARTAGFSGADLECLVNEAGLLAVRRSRDTTSEVVLSAEDFDEALAPRGSARQRFDRVDALLLESTTQLACPTGKARVRLTLVGGTQVEGELEWADAAFVKLRGRGPRESAIVPKHQITTVETLEGTEGAADADVVPDRSAARSPGLA